MYGLDGLFQAFLLSCIASPIMLAYICSAFSFPASRIAKASFGLLFNFLVNGYFLSNLFLCCIIKLSSFTMYLDSLIIFINYYRIKLHNVCYKQNTNKKNKIAYVSAKPSWSYLLRLHRVVLQSFGWNKPTFLLGIEPKGNR